MYSVFRGGLKAKDPGPHGSGVFRSCRLFVHGGSDLALEAVEGDRAGVGGIARLNLLGAHQFQGGGRGAGGPDCVEGLMQVRGIVERAADVDSSASAAERSFACCMPQSYPP